MCAKKDKEDKLHPCFVATTYLPVTESSKYLRLHVVRVLFRVIALGGPTVLTLPIIAHCFLLGDQLKNLVAGRKHFPQTPIISPF